MAFDPVMPAVDKLLAALRAAGDRGVTVHFFIDSYNFLIGDGLTFGPLWWRRTMPHTLKGGFAAIQEALQRLKQHHVKVVVTNPPTRSFTSPFAGRSHIKISIINNTVYLGGCNIEKQHLDSMVRWENAADAAWLYDLMMRRNDTPQTIAAFGPNDITQKLSDSSDLLIDVGARKQSTIYKQALDVIDAAQDWLIITCQFFPNSTTAEHLRAAYKRGVKIFPIFNHYNAHGKPKNLLQHAVTGRERLRMPSSFFTHELAEGSTYLHAKIIASEQEAIIGSHNYVSAGVNFGTAEIALHKKDGSFARAAAELIVTETGFLHDPAFEFLR